MNRRSASRTSPSFLVLGLVGLLALASCGNPTDDSGVMLQTRFRFIAEDPLGPPAREELHDAAVSFAWRLDGEGECLPIWPPEDAVKQVHLAGEIFPLEQMEGRVRMTTAWPVKSARSPKMADVDRFDVELVSGHSTNTLTGDVAVYWAGPGEKLSARHGLIESRGTLGPEGRRLYRIGVGSHAGWTGDPQRIRWVFASLATAGPVSLCAVTGIDETLPKERLHAWLVSGWKGTLGGQIRSALPAVPGLPIERTVTMPTGAELRLFYGAPGGVRNDLDFEVWAQPAGGARERLGQWRLASGDGRDRWHEALVDLRALAGSQTVLSLELAATGELDPGNGLPLWGNPEIVAP